MPGKKVTTRMEVPTTDTGVVEQWTEWSGEMGGKHKNMSPWTHTAHGLKQTAGREIGRSKESIKNDYKGIAKEFRACLKKYSM